MTSGFLRGLFGGSKPKGYEAANEQTGDSRPAAMSALQDSRQISLRCAEAREEERRRMAVDLHDGPIQQMVNLVLRLDMAERALPPGSEEVRRELENLRHFAKSTLQDMRRFIFELRPASLDEFVLLPVLRQYVQDFRAQYQIPVEIQLEDADWNLGRDVEINLFRVIQEALTNVRKHSDATQVDLILSRPEHTAIAEIRDNGKGFDVRGARLRARNEKRLGLASMEDRARALGGTLTITSGEGGTTVKAAIPIQKNEPTV